MEKKLFIIIHMIGIKKVRHIYHIIVEKINVIGAMFTGKTEAFLRMSHI